MRAVIILAFAATSLLGQASSPPAASEVRGTVVELGTNVPIPGATVTLSRFAPDEQGIFMPRELATVASSADGSFTFRSPPAGMVVVNAKRDGFRSAGEVQAEVTASRPLTVRISMVRPGTLRGRAADADGHALPQLHVIAEAVSGYNGGRHDALTDADGTFTIDNLTPGRYIVHPVPTPPAGDDLMPFSENAFRIVDEDVASSYWPGDVPTPEQALPVEVAAGGIANLGAITIRKVPYYRVHVSLTGECHPNERWTYRIETVPASRYVEPERLSACVKEFLLTGIPPGAHQLVLWVGREVKAWSIVPFTVAAKNVAVALALSPPGEITGRVTVTDGRDIVALGGAQVTLRSADHLPSLSGISQPDAKGVIAPVKIAGERQILSVETQRDTYVREIRYNGRPLTGPSFDFVPGARLEVILDSGAAIVQGQIPAGHSVLLVREGAVPPNDGSYPPFQFARGSGATSDFAVRVPPGEYRVLTLSRTEDLAPAALAARLENAPHITMSPGGTKTVDLKPPEDTK